MGEWVHSLGDGTPATNWYLQPFRPLDTLPDPAYRTLPEPPPTLLRTLSSRDRINIVAYSENPSFCFADFTPVTPESLQAAADFTSGLRARGQTDLFSPLMHVLDLPRNPARPLLVVLLTDGRA